ncbi:MAG: hypothetical protein JNL54_12120 [Kineosporiaceae bacterium]|nr:hypothetical protein [Kineosporiaceae bacterium]
MTAHAPQVTSQEGITPPLARTRAQLRDDGASDHEISRRLHNGRLIALRRGILAPPGLHPLDAEAAAAVRALRRDVAVSHAHAARLWGLPEPRAGWPPLAVTAVTGPTRRRDGLHVLVAPCSDEEVTRDPQGVPVTTLARTVADCLRTLPPADALAMADAALRRLGLSTNDLFIALYRQRGWPGVVRARTLGGLASPRRETPLESWSAWAFHDCAVRAPMWQVDLATAEGQFVGRVDCWWPAGVVGEADGRTKMLLAAAEQGGATARTLAELVAAERRREQAIRDLGAELVRWEAADVLHSGRALDLARRLNRTLAERRHFIGRAHPAHTPQPSPEGDHLRPNPALRGA